MKKFFPLSIFRPSGSERSGFSLIELLIFSVIFALIMMAFITILVAVLKVQTRQSGAAEVNQQSQFLLQQIQYYVERSSLIELPQDVATTTLKLRMAAASEDPTYIYFSSGAVYIKQTDGGTAQALTSSKVTISSFTFTKHSNAPSHDSVSVSFVVTYNNANPAQQFSQSLETAIARVSAATFDSNVVPSSTAVYNLGVTGQVWNSVNNVIYFSGTNVGIAGTPTQLFQVGVGGGTTGDIYVAGAGNGIILKNANNSCVRLYYTTGGQLATSSVTCT
jgi:Tfp pilus assembly protein PilV